MNPFKLKNEIEDALSKQLRFMYPIDVVCPDSSIAKEVKRLFPIGEEDKERRHMFVKSAYVEAIPQYKPGRTLQELVEADVLHQSTAEALSRYFNCPIDKARLHEHQEASLISVKDGRNLLVCTGTGSGKTESFLIPVLDAIARERIEKGENYVPGVRAMILYPMNALVNDQVLRIRNLLKSAHASNGIEEIVGIKDITYGIYTGDLATESREQDLEELDEQALNAINNATTVPVDHPFFSDDVVPKTEYTRRSRWNSVDDGGDGPADILITNYAMLERLMLNPKTSSLFSQTWKFIILDEAHTYDGSMGTEIAWLLKRLSYRVGGANRLQYLATSATLIESDDGGDNTPGLNSASNEGIEQDIVDSFASKIFPTNERTFSIQLGNPQYTETKPGGEAGRYSDILTAPAIDVGQHVQSLPEQLQPAEFTSLFMQYLWLKDVEQRLERYGYLKQENIKEEMALGDIVCIASILSELGAQSKLEFSGGAIADVLASFPRKELIIGRACSDLEAELRYDVEDWLLGEQNNVDVSICAQDLDKVFMSIVSIFDSYDISDIDTFTPSALPVQITNQTMDILMEYVGAYEQWCILLKDIRKKIQAAWSQFFNQQEDMEVEDCFTQYILSHRELHELFEYMKGKSHVEYNELAKITMGGNVEQFEDFCQVLALSKSNVSINKPLVDLRFHQTVQGVHAMMARFAKNDNAVAVELLPNMSGVQLAGDRIYNVGCCQHCGQPYILAYSKCIEAGNVTDLANYEDDEYGHLFALAWEPANDDLIEADDMHNNYWLEFKKGKLHRSDKCPGAADDFIQIHYVATAGDAVNRKHISKCPSCGDIMNQGGDYTLIAPYKLSDDHARCFILRVLTANADRDLVPVGKPAEGRKVLAFSDSRGMAARIPITFDEISRHKLFDNVVYNTVRQYGEGQSVSFCPNNQNGGNSIVDVVIKELKKRHAVSLLKREYTVNNEVREFPAKDVASQLILETVRNSSSRSLVGRKYLEIVSYAYENKDDNRSWRQFVRSCGNSPELAETIFFAIYRYLVRNGQLTCSRLQPDDGRGNNFSLDYTRAEDKDYSLGRKIKKERRQADDKNTIAFFQANNNPSPYFSKLIKKYDANGKITDKVSMLDRLWQYLTQSQCLIEIQRGRYVVNAADIRLCKGINQHDELFFDDSYFFRIEEHSGQIAKGVALEHQSSFSSGKINILSCSTTFEMGVDLGNLNIVFLCNLPPSVANYRQRAGRAGRRAGSSAYVLTYVGGESTHDSYFSNDPASFLFQKVTPPIIYTDILSYSAKHMRAEALSCFLEWCGPESSWKRCSSFLANPIDTESLGLISRLEEWYGASNEIVMQRCNEVAGYELNYNPAADLCFQLLGTHYDGLNGYSLIELAGPCLDIGSDGKWNYWKSPVLYRYIKKCEKLLADGEDWNHRACRRMGREDIAAYLASMRVLPRYGFPCDTVQLNVADTDVKLQRDRLIALREYLPGSSVAANKKYYVSRHPQWLAGEPQNAVNAQPIRVYRCSECKEFFGHYDASREAKCPKCGTKYEGAPLKLIVPDYFKGRRVVKKIFKAQQIKECYGGGLQEEYPISETNLAVASSITREILYVNTAWHDDEADGMMHVLRTDIVIWKLQSKPAAVGDKLNNYDAWMSALQAILKSASKVLKVHSKDISGMITQDVDNRYMMVIYDSSTSGAGSVLKLMPGNRQEGIEVEILKNARDLCVNNGDCSCGNLPPEEGNKTVVGDVELYNGADINTSRLAKACYKCLLSYGNRRHHSKLDAYDAAVILNAMLGNQPIDPKTDDGNSRQGRANNPPGVGKQAPDSQTASKDRVVTADFELAGINRGLGEAVREGTPRNEIQGQNSQQQQNSHSDKEKEICLTERSLSQYQTFEPIEGNYSLMKKMISCKGETFLVRKDGKVFADRLKRVLSGHRASFENAGTVAYADIMKM